MRVSRVLRVLRVLRALRAFNACAVRYGFSGLQLFFQTSVFWVEFAVDRFVATRGKLRVSEVCSNKSNFSNL